MSSFLTWYVGSLSVYFYKYFHGNSFSKLFFLIPRFSDMKHRNKSAVMSPHFSIEILKANRNFYENSFFLFSSLVFSRFFSGFLTVGIVVQLVAFLSARILIFKPSAKHRHLSHSESCSFTAISCLNNVF